MGHNFDELRQAMVDSQVRTTDVTDLRLLDALLSVPREAFVPEQKKPFAYIDDDIEIGSADSGVKRYIMEPSPFARLVQLANVKASDLVLDIGCGTGYSSAVLSRLGSAVIALEADEELAGRATEILVENGFDNVAVVTGPFAAGYPSEGPYDVIFVGGSVDEIPAALFEQLKEGGRLVVVEGHGLSGFAAVHVKVDGVVSGRRAFNLSAKELPGFRKEAEFSL
ncbi:protein-L-isoaspartate O-methyltransferase family protein [Oricola thermophila]|uniref:Protein-L-isoaspartate O-methyltransferase n=1 Tax=Oricola thermophila TaxID=2742145 RepID=A0A6N1VFJ4_9HYPH|nr:protein-L-isoaspartate O-methyltransferase [Oricola thermophila]QKV17737.1 protein-L-isoaspartate O-methyltransferase [Oricola thermophila]